MLLAGRCFAPLSKWQQKEYWLKFLIWGKNVGNKQVSFLFQSEASELNIYIKWKSMQKNLSEEQRQRDQCPAIEWVLDNQEVKSEEKILSLLPRILFMKLGVIFHSFFSSRKRVKNFHFSLFENWKWNKNYSISRRESSKKISRILDYRDSYLIFVTGTTGGACVNFFCQV